MIETSSGLPRKSSEIFVTYSDVFGNVRVILGQVLDNLRTFSESGRKSSENRQKPRCEYVYIIKRTLRVSSKI